MSFDTLDESPRNINPHITEREKAIGRERISRTRLFFSLVLAILYACSDEWHQRFTPGRTSSIIDVFIDTIGSVIGLAISYLVRGRL